MPKRPRSSSGGGGAKPKELSRKDARKAARVAKKASRAPKRPAERKPAAAAAPARAKPLSKAASGSRRVPGANSAFFKSMGVGPRDDGDSDPEDEEIRRLERKLGIKPATASGSSADAAKAVSRPAKRLLRLPPASRIFGHARIHCPTPPANACARPPRSRLWCRCRRPRRGSAWRRSLPRTVSVPK